MDMEDIPGLGEEGGEHRVETNDMEEVEAVVGGHGVHICHVLRAGCCNQECIIILKSGGK